MYKEQPNTVVAVSLVVVQGSLHHEWVPTCIFYRCLVLCMYVTYKSKETVLRTLEEEQVGRGFVSALPQAVHGHQSEVAESSGPVRISTIINQASFTRQLLIWCKSTI